MYRPVGGESVLHIHPQHIEYSGVRTQFLEPRQNPLSGVPAAQPGRVIAREPRRAVVLADPSAEAGFAGGDGGLPGR